jgi:hypothetical protein
MEGRFLDARRRIVLAHWLLLTAELNLTYWGIGNPGPDWNPELRTATTSIPIPS